MYDTTTTRNSKLSLDDTTITTNSKLANKLELERYPSATSINLSGMPYFDF